MRRLANKQLCPATYKFWRPLYPIVPLLQVESQNKSVSSRCHVLNRPTVQDLPEFWCVIEIPRKCHSLLFGELEYFSQASPSRTSNLCIGEQYHWRATDPINANAIQAKTQRERACARVLRESFKHPIWDLELSFAPENLLPIYGFSFLRPIPLFLKPSWTSNTE